MSYANPPHAQPKRLITHSEEFHTDDVFATALLLALFPDAEVIRSRDEAVLQTGDIVYDVGKIYDPAKGRYDHHQAQAGRRENGIVYSSFGLLWKEYGLQYCEGDTQVAAVIDQKLVAPIDATDNGQAIGTPIFDSIYPFTIEDIIKMHNPLQWLDGTEDYNEQFHKAVRFAQDILARLKSQVKDTLTSQKAVLEAYAAAEDKRVIVMERSGAVSDVLDQCPELIYVISQRPEKSWGVLAVSVEAHSFTSKRPFPEAWRAKSADELAEITGIPDIVFCHATGFYAVCKSREGAIALARKSLTA